MCSIIADLPFLKRFEAFHSRFNATDLSPLTSRSGTLGSKLPTFNVCLASTMIETALTSANCLERLANWPATPSFVVFSNQGPWARVGGRLPLIHVATGHYERCGYDSFLRTGSPQPSTGVAHQRCLTMHFTLWRVGDRTWNAAHERPRAPNVRAARVSCAFQNSSRNTRTAKSYHRRHTRSGNPSKCRRCRTLLYEDPLPALLPKSRSEHLPLTVGQKTAPLRITPLSGYRRAAEQQFQSAGSASAPAYFERCSTSRTIRIPCEM